MKGDTAQLVTDEEFDAFVERLDAGEVAPNGPISCSADERSILFAIPFEGFQIHIHHRPAAVPYDHKQVIRDGDDASAHIYSNDRRDRKIFNEKAIGWIEKFVNADTMQKGKAAYDLKKYGKRTNKSLTGLDLAMRGDY